MEKPPFQRPPTEPDLEVEVDAAPTEDGGRRYPLFSGYRAPHDFGKPDEWNDAMYEFLNAESLHPGETGRALMWLFVPERNEGRLYTGMPFTVHEGSRLIGRGRITQVLKPELERAV